MMSTTSVEVIHNLPDQRFEARLGNSLARADYRRDGNTLLMVHTEVPPALEGRGIAAQLVQAAFDYARGQGLKILPLCSYVRVWVQRHPEVQPLLDSGR